jgi:hypothetical protein
MSNNFRNPDEYYRWPHSPEPSRNKFGIRLSGACVFDIDGFPQESFSSFHGLRMQSKRQSTSFHSLLKVLIDGYRDGTWLSLTEITDRLSVLPTPEFDKYNSDVTNPVSFEILTRRALSTFRNETDRQSIEGDRWQFGLDYPVTKKQVEYTPYEFQDINPLHCGRFLLTNAGYVIANIAKDPPYPSGKRVRNFQPRLPINLNPTLG